MTHKVHIDERQIVTAIIEKLDADAALTALLAVGSGSHKIRYADQLEDEVSPSIVISAVSDTPDPVNRQSHSMIIQIDCSMKAARLDAGDEIDPQAHTLNIKRRVRELMIGTKGVGHSFLVVDGCAGIVIHEDSDIPLRKDTGRDSEFWIATQQYRINYVR